jgi:DNA-binding response OmpR family regulator
MPNLLLVEDDTATAEVMTLTLEEAGYTIIGVARTLEEALGLIRHERVDLALLDVQLDGSTGDGISVALELLRHQPIPLIFVTGRLDPATQQRIASTHAAAFLSKPFRPIDLLMQVALVLQNGAPAPRPALLPDDLLFADQGQWVRLPKAEVVYAEANRHLTLVYGFDRKRPFVVSNHLSHVARYLDSDTFYPISRSCIINLAYLIGLKDHHALMRTDRDPAGQPKAISIPADKRSALLNRLPLVRTR